MALFRRRPEIGDQRGERPRFRRRSPNIFPCGKAVSTVTLPRDNAMALIGRRAWPQFRKPLDPNLADR